MMSDKHGASLGMSSDAYVDMFDRYMAKYLGAEHDDIPPRLLDAMMYSLSSGGKRLRPLLCLRACEACGRDPIDALPMALALEFVHTASLIHDDLPCLDDDDMRRGRAACHRAFGEALAVFAADSLWLWAFGTASRGLRNSKIAPDRILRAIEELSDAAGPAGMCGGQVLDSDPESRADDSSFVYMISSMKTASLIRASVVTGAIIGGASDEQLDAWAEYGLHLGVAYQMHDDILDVTATAEELGKTPGKDAKAGKVTFVSEFGIEEASELARDESETAALALGALFPNGHPLIDLARGLTKRRN